MWERDIPSKSHPIYERNLIYITVLLLWITFLQLFNYRASVNVVCMSIMYVYKSAYCQLPCLWPCYGAINILLYLLNLKYHIFIPIKLGVFVWTYMYMYFVCYNDYKINDYPKEINCFNHIHVHSADFGVTRSVCIHLYFVKTNNIVFRVCFNIPLSI